ncbi:hypothetical protein GLOIN_2v1502791 [Rhizophagus irregularis DAOM 181602=DAOM 197198]|uniref:Uncharacterized protein n=1 Tax=Rhizophagus irregularis (strain DAOM 181602 / DAOM 197198 / MUCL 43194) TaxID=747089 RepID=A0A2P4QW84_RHIID|nr:hypothetical protein GLOIN_2v1502791 [Rhizophagus irregularis DAOM 181602=DAOM 197198]POG81818.1 hypothetical protein GLOIN_2v1502791 [Rhizophagus irregularis DAOM 181602=DAOM 197198]|eukprot:XP_025188684.1 hypothetical protein GLOIN_2v1502791 [Rhizophagus irregularis DAOM 181602=DAOM 197198]
MATVLISVPFVITIGCTSEIFLSIGWGLSLSLFSLLFLLSLPTFLSIKLAAVVSLTFLLLLVTSFGVSINCLCC